MNYRTLEKGTVLGSNWFYVVVKIVMHKNEACAYCICDNANNIYSFTIKEILETTTPHKWLVLSPKKAVHIAGWGRSLLEEDEDIFRKIDREIPIGVLAEVLAGQHDHRFDHWDEK